MLQQLETHGLVLNKEKCVFSAAQGDYLGHAVDASGVRLLPARVAAISDFSPPFDTGRAPAFPRDGELLPPFPSTSSFYSQATNRCNMWSPEPQHAGTVVPAAG